MNTPLQPSSTLADLAVAFPAASRVFRRHGLDYCCHGRRPVSEACAERGLDANALLSEVAAEARTAADAESWSDRPLPEIVERIVDYYHARLRTELPLLLQMARKVEAVHAEKESVPRGLAAHVDALSQTLLDHLDKEEQGLFPMLLSGRGGQPSAHGLRPRARARGRRPRPPEDPRPHDGPRPSGRGLHDLACPLPPPRRARGRGDGARPPREQRPLSPRALRGALNRKETMSTTTPGQRQPPLGAPRRHAPLHVPRPRLLRPRGLPAGPAHPRARRHARRRHGDDEGRHPDRPAGLAVRRRPAARLHLGPRRLPGPRLDGRPAPPRGDDPPRREGREGRGEGLRLPLARPAGRASRRARPRDAGEHVRRRHGNRHDHGRAGRGAEARRRPLRRPLRRRPRAEDAPAGLRDVGVDRPRRRRGERR